MRIWTAHRPARLRIRVPRLVTSSIEAGPERDRPVLDGRDVVADNCWNVSPGTLAMIGRPAVWVAIDVTTPRITLGPVTIPARRLRWEQDFGGHLFLAIGRSGGTHVTIIEAGPLRPNQTGALVPFGYPEDRFARRGFQDFDPIPIEPPHGLDPGFFNELVARTQRAYDGDQRYLAIEIPFLRVGRDSNSYTVGVLLACGVDPRSIPTPSTQRRFELTGYPGAEDPVHRANFGAYLGAPQPLDEHALAAPYHDADGSVRLVVVGGEPHGRVRTPRGDVSLDRHGRCVLSPADARHHGLVLKHMTPPEQIRKRRWFPKDPAAAGALITLIVANAAVPLRPGDAYRGTVAARNDALGIAILRSKAGEIVLPLTELGVELRDPKRVGRLLQIGSELTVGLHRDRHPRLVAHGRAARADALRGRRAHAPRPMTLALVAAMLAAVTLATIAIMGTTRRFGFTES